MKIVGPYTSPTIYSEHPGIVELTSSDPSVASVDASVTIEGTRVWAANNQKWTDGFNVPAAGAHAIRMRDNCTIGFFIDTAMVQNSPIFMAPEKHLVSNYLTYRRINWHFDLRRITDTQVTLNYSQSNMDGTNESTFAFANRLAYGSKHLVIVTFSGDTLTRYLNNNTPEDTLTRTAPTGVHDNPYCRIYSAGNLYYWGSVLSSADIALFMAGSATSAAPIVAYALDEEGTAKAYDDSTNAYDGVYDLDATYPASQIVRDYTDDPGDPVIPFQPFTITPNSVGTFTITARRRRQGVPDRATDEEKYETTSETFTITEMPAEVVQYVRLLITTSTPGTVDIASSDPSVVTFPSSIVVGPTLQYEVLGTVVGAGTSTITTSMGGAILDTTTVTIEDTPTVIEAGPNQDVRTKLL
jgi:hypothetical protein